MFWKTVQQKHNTKKWLNLMKLKTGSAASNILLVRCTHIVVTVNILIINAK